MVLRLLLSTLGGCAGSEDGDSGAAVVAEVPDWLGLPGAVTCASPLAEPAWTDVARDWGLGGLFDPDAEHTSSAGAAMADLEGDGDLDIALAYTGAPTTIFLRDGDRFVQGPQLPVGQSQPRAVGVMDNDGDGDWDLFVATQDAMEGYFRNDGDLVFTDVTLTAMDLEQNPSYNLPALADWDADGDLDAYIPATEPSSTKRWDVLVRNDGAGRLERVPEGFLPASHGSATLQAFWFDADQDGDPDPHAVNDFGWTLGGNVMFANEGDHFADVSADCRCTATAGGMSGDVGDVNRDGLADYYIANADGNNLFVAMGDGTFVDFAAASGASERDPTGGGTMVWSALVYDYENDGDLDLFNAHGDFFSPLEPFEPVDAPDTLLEQQPDGSFVDVAPGYGLDSVGSERSILADDLNGDGVLDVVVTVVTDWPHLYLSDGCTAPGWLEVDVLGPGLNPHGVGAKVEIEAGGQRQVGWAWPQSGLNASREPRVHFGLGDAQQVDFLRVTLPTGEVFTSEATFPARQRVVVDAR